MDFDYRFIRQKRKTIAISVDGDGNVVIKAPFYAKEKDIMRFAESKEDWIRQTIVRMQQQTKEKKKHMFRMQTGEELPYLGRKLELSVYREERKNAHVIAKNNRLLLFVPYDADDEMMRYCVEKWYRHQAALEFEQAATYFAEKLSVTYGTIRIKDQKSRWGSCSGKGNLNFNWRLLMAPKDVMDYVVIHELCHLRHMDHSRDFWEMVAGICPDYKEKKQWLKEHGQELVDCLTR